ncbi:MAG: bifunctional nuclease family protein [Deltaproteobacteria bacterium]
MTPVLLEMELNKIIIDEKRQDQIIVLKEKAGERMLPIVIGFLEASAIKMRLSGLVPPRPLTHDLLQALLAALGATLEKVVIDKLEDSTFHAKLHLVSDGGARHIVDARPSDSIALAVRVKAPLFVDEEVLRHSQISPPEY